MKTINFYFIILLVVAGKISASAQLKVHTTGEVRIGAGIYSPGASLEVQESNQTTEARIFATTANNARVWGINSIYAYGFGVGSDGKGYIWKNVNSPSPIIKFDQNKTMFDVGTYDVWIDYAGGGPTVRPSSSNNGYLGTSSYFWYRTYTNSIYRNYEYSLSDKRVKSNIQPIGSPLETIKKLNGVTFDYTQEAFKSNSDENTQQLMDQGKNNIGFRNFCYFQSSHNYFVG